MNVFMRELLKFMPLLLIGSYYLLFINLHLTAITCQTVHKSKKRQLSIQTFIPEVYYSLFVILLIKKFQTSNQGAEMMPYNFNDQQQILTSERSKRTAHK